MPADPNMVVTYDLHADGTEGSEPFDYCELEWTSVVAEFRHFWA